MLALLADSAEFNAVGVGARGRTSAWQNPEANEVELYADALWRLARESATEAA